MLVFFIVLILLIIILIRIKSFSNRTNYEFAITFIILSSILCQASNTKEYFSETNVWNLDAVYQLPKYVENVVGEGIDKLIAAAKPDMSQGNDVNETTYLTPEIFVDDPDVTSSDKYNLLIDEYLLIDKMFTNIKTQYPNVYNAIFN